MRPGEGLSADNGRTAAKFRRGLKSALFPPGGIGLSSGAGHGGQDESGSMTTHDGAAEGSASDQIDSKIAALGDWRGETLARVRALIRAAVPDVVEEVKWRGVPVWSHGGILCTGETYKDKVKLTFAHGAALADPKGLFNASLEGNTRRAIDIAEGAAIDEAAFKALVREAAKWNAAKAAARHARRRDLGSNR
jgi:hypothetical protein